MARPYAQHSSATPCIRLATSIERIAVSIIYDRVQWLEPENSSVSSSACSSRRAAVHALREAWRSAHPTFLSSLDFKKLKVPHHLNGLRGLGGVSDTYIAQINIFQLVEIREGAAAATAGYPAGNAGIGKEDISSAGGWWDDRMGDSHRGDAEQSQDGRAALRRRLMRMRRMLHPIMRRRYRPVSVRRISVVCGGRSRGCCVESCELCATAEGARAQAAILMLMLLAP